MTSWLNTLVLRRTSNPEPVLPLPFTQRPRSNVKNAHNSTSHRSRFTRAHKNNRAAQPGQMTLVPPDGSRGDHGGVEEPISATTRLAHIQAARARLAHAARVDAIAYHWRHVGQWSR